MDSNQVIGFSSTYIVGKKAEFGYSRDKRSDMLQINFGISTGINGIPTALTIHTERECSGYRTHESLKLFQMSFQLILADV